VTAIDEDYRHARVELRMRPWNRNYVGTHFGGSLFAMTDPFWMILLMHALGRGYVVWDRTGEIEFRKAVREDVYAQFELDEPTLDAIRAAIAADPGGRAVHGFQTDVRTGEGKLVARVRKQVHLHARLEPGSAAAGGEDQG
ncbi:MAG TPA: DUF4442 domain-containing protein, partial [Xanthomonadaceae bacterium]|nr:DUF4442 domain-containing protein [Xanthomonadaceae bacterium]